MSWKPRITSENAQPDGTDGSAFWAGRAWWYRRDDRPGPHAEWYLLHKVRGKFAIGISHDDCEAEWCIHLALPWLCNLFFLWPGNYRRPSKEWEIAVHSGSFWWDWGQNPDEWSSSDPKWRRWSINFADTLFGGDKHSKQVLSTHKANVYLPEGAHPVTVELTLVTWKRPRWPWPAIRYVAEVKVVDPAGIPVPGKGESAWDCGDNAIMSHGTRARTVEEAVASLTQSVLKTRNRYGGSDAYAPEAA